MNDFANSQNSGILKNDYRDEPATDAMREALKRRKQKLIDQGSVSENEDYNSKDKDEN